MSENRSAALKELMMRRPIAVAAFAAIAAMLLAAGYLSRRETSLLSQVEPVPVLIAAADIEAGAALDEEALTSATVPRRYQEPGALATIAEAAGRVAQVPIRTGMQITAALARRPSQLRGLSASIPPGRRAIAITLPRAAAGAGLIRPGDAVDVLATFDLGNEAAVRRTTLTLVPAATVLAVFGELIGGISTAESGQPQKAGLFSALPTPQRDSIDITLAATPEEAQAIAYAQESGALVLALRPFGDEEGSGRPTATSISTISSGNGELMPLRRAYREYRGKR